VDFDTVADELYALAPEDFTAVRNEQAKQARSDGDRELAERIRRLQKPTSAAWLVNQLVRQRRDEIQPLLELGAGLREATASLSGDDLRRLSQQQHEVIYALVQQSKRIASAMGQRVSDDTARGVEQTLRAALADENAAGKLACGRLAEVLTHVGFGSEASTPSRVTAQPDAPTNRAARNKAEQREERLERARQHVADAHQALDDARHDRDRAAHELNGVKEQAQQWDDRIRELRDELDAAERKQTDLDRDRRRLDRDRDRAERAVREAERRLRNATDRQEALASGE
jgi:chromosome segregation ATPase